MLYVTDSKRTIRHDVPQLTQHILLNIFMDHIELMGIAEDEQYGIAGETVHPAMSGKKVVCSDMFTLGIDELRTMQDWKDACYWGIGSNGFMQPYFIFNSLADSFATRREFQNNRAFITATSFVKFTNAFSEAHFLDMNYFVLKPNPDSIVISNVEPTIVAYSDFYTHVWESFPALELSGPDTISAEGIQTLGIQAKLGGEILSHPLDVELEHVNGYLPKTRIRLTESGEFRVSALGLEAGDTIKIKAGFRYLGAQAEKILQVC